MPKSEDQLTALVSYMSLVKGQVTWLNMMKNMTSAGWNWVDGEAVTWAQSTFDERRGRGDCAIVWAYGRPVRRTGCTLPNNLPYVCEKGK